MTQIIESTGATTPIESPASGSPHSILFLIDQLTELGGAERMMFELANQLAARGYRISIVTFRPNPSPEAYSYAPEIIVLPLRSCFSLQAFAVARRLRRLIHERKIDLAQTYFESADLFGALVCWLSGVRHVCSSRRDMGLLRKTKHAVFYKLCAPAYTRIFAVSQSVAAWHQKQDAIVRNKLVVIYNGVRLDAYDRAPHSRQICNQLGLPPNARLVTTVANINRWKGLDVFLDAAAIVHRQHPDIVFVIAGDKTDRDYYHQLCSRAEQLGLASHVFFVGRVEDVPSLLLASDVFALLSQTEGFPNVVIEAMAAGVPVVATDVGGTSEAVIDGLSGYLVPNGDHEAAAAKIHLFLSQPDHTRSLTRAARARVESEFSMEAMVQRHVEVYDALPSA